MHLLLLDDCVESWLQQTSWKHEMTINDGGEENVYHYYFKRGAENTARSDVNTSIPSFETELFERTDSIWIKSFVQLLHMHALPPFRSSTVGIPLAN